MAKRMVDTALALREYVTNPEIRNNLIVHEGINIKLLTDLYDGKVEGKDIGQRYDALKEKQTALRPYFSEITDEFGKLVDEAVPRAYKLAAREEYQNLMKYTGPSGAKAEEMYDRILRYTQLAEMFSPLGTELTLDFLDVSWKKYPEEVLADMKSARDAAHLRAAEHDIKHLPSTIESLDNAEAIIATVNQIRADISDAHLPDLQTQAMMQMVKAKLADISTHEFEELEKCRDTAGFRLHSAKFLAERQAAGLPDNTFVQSDLRQMEENIATGLPASGRGKSTRTR